jgi:hypothetical protein
MVKVQIVNLSGLARRVEAMETLSKPYLVLVMSRGFARCSCALSAEIYSLEQWRDGAIGSLANVAVLVELKVVCLVAQFTSANQTGHCNFR